MQTDPEAAGPVLQASGGWLHIHENVKDADEKRWVQETAAKIACLAAETGREWEVSVGHLERVKWCGPSNAKSSSFAVPFPCCLAGCR